jgi:hypothetical protein
MGPSAPDGNDSEHLLDQAAAGDQEAWGNLLARHRPGLHNMISLRLDRAKRGMSGAISARLGTEVLGANAMDRGSEPDTHEPLGFMI